MATRHQRAAAPPQPTNRGEQLDLGGSDAACVLDLILACIVGCLGPRFWGSDADRIVRVQDLLDLFVVLFCTFAGERLGFRVVHIVLVRVLDVRILHQERIFDVARAVWYEFLIFPCPSCPIRAQPIFDSICRSVPGFSMWLLSRDWVSHV